MPFADADGVRLYYEETGSGDPIVFVHEFAGDYRSWEPQVRYFSRRYRCVAFNARGYPPSDVPEDRALYSQDIAADDIAAVMRVAGIDRAHVVGMSMGGFAALHFGLRYADMARSIVVGACGYGAKPEESEQYALDSEAIAVEYENRGAAEVAEIYANGAYRLQLKQKDPRGWAEFRDQLAEHSTEGSARTMRGVQKFRPSLWHPGGRALGNVGAGAGRRRRRGRLVPRARDLSQAHHPDRGAADRAQDRPRGESRGAGAVQPGAGRFLRHRRSRAVDRTAVRAGRVRPALGIPRRAIGS